MNAVHSIIEALIAGGMNAADAAALVARAAVEMTAPAGAKSAAAARQQRYRDRKNSVTKRNESVTERNEDNRNETVTKRNEGVTPLRSAETHISYLPSSSDNLTEKKESKKERVFKKRNAPLPDDWTPSLRSYQIAEEHGANVQIVEQIFRDYLKSTGKLYADYDAAFHNFLRNQRRFSGNASHAKTENPRSGSLIAALDRALEQSVAQDAALAAPENTILSFPGRSVFGS